MAEARHQRFMRQALRLAARGRGRTSPNPMVGAVLVNGRGQVVATGHHLRAGGDHAEVRALSQAGRRARGASLYVNLEPCSHEGRTGPCSRAIIAAGVRRVVIGMQDPNPLVNGKGIAALRRAGLEVVTGVLEQECRRLNEAFCCYISRGRPFVTFKAAVTLDGRVAARSGDSRWVTGPRALREGHRLRHANDAIMVGVGTVLVDNPRLTCREIRGGRDPVRVVVDSRLRTPPEAAVLQARSKSPTWIVTTSSASRTRAARLERAGATVVRLESAGKRVEVPALLRWLAQQEIAALLLEGGPTLAGSFWGAGLVDRVVAFVAPKVLGDPRALPMLAAAPAAAMGDATLLDDVTTRRVGDDLMLTGTPRWGRG